MTLTQHVKKKTCEDLFFFFCTHVRVDEAVLLTNDAQQTNRQEHEDRLEVGDEADADLSSEIRGRPSSC